MDAESRSLGNFPSTTASNFWVFPTKPVEVDCCLFSTCYLTLTPQGGEVATIPMRNGKGGSTNLSSLRLPPGVLPSTPVLVTCRRVMLIHPPHDTTSTMISFFSGSKSVCGANNLAQSIGQSPGSFTGTKQGWSGYSIVFVQNPRC